MKFDLMAIILMIIAIAVGQWAGSYLIVYIGSLGGGIVGSLFVGLIIYVIYTFAAKGKFTFVNALIFAMLIYAANIMAAYASGLIGVGGGYLSLVIAGVFMALLWGWVGGKNAQKTSKLKAPKL